MSYVIVIDPHWGRKKYLWTHLERVMREGSGQFESTPDPTLGLEEDSIF